MQGLAQLLKTKISAKEVKTQRWQEQALEATKKLIGAWDCKGSVFRAFKTDARTAQLALQDSIELDKAHVKYFFKVFSELRKKV